MRLNSISIALSSLVAFANAASWKFNVVSIAGTAFDMGVKYENQVYKMTTEIYPLYTTTINSGASTAYKYVVLDKSGNVVEEEELERNYTPELANINEVYERETKTVDVQPLPRVFDSLYKSGTENYQEFPRNEIYTIWAKCDDDAYEQLKFNPFISGSHKNENFANCTINIISKRESFQRTGSVRLVGYNSRLYKKLSWKFKLDKKIFGRKTLKVRSLASDPTLMRDKLASELYRSLGVPTYGGTYARVMINHDVWGLYSIVDTIGGKWIAANIHGDEKARVGYVYKMYSSVPNGPFASLRYLGEDPDTYENCGSYEVDEIDKQDPEATNTFYRLARFTKMFEDWVNTYGNDQSEAAVQALEKFFDLETLLRQMVIETLTVSYDNFWAQLGNYAVYFNPEFNRYQVIPYDFDGTFYGSCGSHYYASDYLTDCITWADNTLPDKYFVNNLLSHSLIKKRFQQIMYQTINKVFNVNGVNQFIDSVADLIREDIEWNFELIDEVDDEVPGYVNHYTLQNFEDNINYKKVIYNGDLNYNDAHFGIKEWVKLRGGYCYNYVKEELGDAADEAANIVQPVPVPNAPAQSVAIVAEPTVAAPTAAPTATQTAAAPTAAQTAAAPTAAQTVAPKPVVTTPKITKKISTKKSPATTRNRVTKKVTVKKVIYVTKLPFLKNNL